MPGCYKYSIYVAANNGHYITGYTHDPSLDASFLLKQGYDNFYLLTIPLVAGQAIPLFERLSKDGEFKGAFLEGTIKQLLEKTTKVLKSAGWHLGIPSEIFLIKGIDLKTPRPLPVAEQLETLLEALQGRILFLPEIEGLLAVRKLDRGFEIEEALQLLCLENKCRRMPGIKAAGRRKFVCSRCGQSEGVVAIGCASCGDTCYHCEICLSMGEARFCQTLYAISGNCESNRLPIKQVTPEMSVTLSPAQKDASNALRQFILQSGQKEKLVWAACGAGKTEVTFRAIAEVLSRSQKVLFATPRKDIVEELVVRLGQAFPEFPVACLHGTSREKFSEAAIVVSTTHQVLRFYHNFGLIILDEVDAYPFNISPMLQAGVLRAKAKDGKMIYMTATPSEEMLVRQKKGKLSCVWIPARYHGYPLPQPRILVEKHLPFLEVGNRIPESIIQIIHETLEGDLAQLFIFVPSIEGGKRVAQALQRALRLPPFNDFQGSWVQFSHSRDEDRERKLSAFRKGEFPILVTTTICERGLTLQKVNVLVLFADSDRIFNASALVQMAGRSGRTKEYPLGKVWFAGSRCSREMKLAVERIKKINLQAWNMGYLRPDAGRYLERRRKG